MGIEVGATGWVVRATRAAGQPGSYARRPVALVIEILELSKKLAGLLFGQRMVRVGSGHGDRVLAGCLDVNRHVAFQFGYDGAPALVVHGFSTVAGLPVDKDPYTGRGARRARAPTRCAGVPS
jgi:hypothetical protein